MRLFSYMNRGKRVIEKRMSRSPVEAW